MPTVERAGASIWCSDAGRGETVLLIHGGLFDAMGSERFWQRPHIDDALIGAGFNVLMPDRRFCGRTSAPYAVHSWQVEAADMLAVLRAAAMPSAHVVAGSNGCSVALRFALGAARAVRSLVLCWPAAPENDALERAFDQSAEAVESMGPAAYLESLRAQGVPPPDADRPGFPFGYGLLGDQHTSGRFLEKSAAEAAAIMRETSAALLPGTPLRGVNAGDLERLGHAGFPITIIPAEPEDPAHPRATAEALAAAIPGATMAQGFPPSPSAAFAPDRAAFVRTLTMAFRNDQAGV